MRTYPQSIERIKEPLHVATYIRTKPSGASSYGCQESTLKKIIDEHPGWVYEGSYADGIGAPHLTEESYGLRSLLKECEAGNIDLILTKSVPHFAANVSECVDITRKLSSLPRPVGVYFEAEGIYSLDKPSIKE